jgi:hypothetical protein
MCVAPYGWREAEWEWIAVDAPQNSYLISTDYVPGTQLNTWHAYLNLIHKTTPGDGVWIKERELANQKT